ncbi:MAG: type II toxin-antitoxin system PemK/MazF family toxin [bacterium]
MTHGTNCSQSIVLVHFPFTDLSSEKKRPALVTSPDWFNAQYQDVVLCIMSSSYTPEELNKERDIVCEVSINNLDFGTIAAKSIVKIPKIFTFEQSNIIKKVT